MSTNLDFTDNVKVNLELMTRCGGSCGGCMLDPEERIGGANWDKDRLRRLTPFVQGFIDGHVAAFNPLEIAINCGQGDHLLAEPEDLRDLVGWIAEAGLGRSIGFITASAVGKRDRVFKAVDAIRDASLAASQPIWIDLVFDPAKTLLGGFRETYRANIDHIRTSFGDVDFNINVGPDTVAHVRPRDLHDFLRESGIMRFTMNLTPTTRSMPGFRLSWEAIMDWAAEVMDLWDPADGTEINLGQVTSIAMLQAAGLEDEGSDTMATLVSLSARRSVYIDRSDWIWHTQAGFGDVAFSHRIDWRPTTRIPATREEAFAAVEDSARRFTARILSGFMRSPTCVSCPFLTLCPRIGAAALQAANGGAISERCPSGLRPLLETFAGYGRESLSRMLCEKTYTPVPAIFSSDIRPNARAIDARAVPGVAFGVIDGGSGT